MHLEGRSAGPPDGSVGEDEGREEAPRRLERVLSRETRSRQTNRAYEVRTNDTFLLPVRLCCFFWLFARVSFGPRPAVHAITTTSRETETTLSEKRFIYLIKLFPLASVARADLA